jgi:zinc transporter, ZIP family
MPTESPAVLSLVVQATLIAWVGSALGAFAAWMPRQPGPRTCASMLGCAAGVMVAVTIHSLLPQAQHFGASSTILVAAVACGALLIWLLDLVLPHQHPGAAHADHASPLTSASVSTRTSTLIAAALIIHNIPEGAAVGSAVAAGETVSGGGLVWAIALHNIIEGILVAFPLRAAGYRPWVAFTVAQTAGIAEFLAGIAAASAVTSIAHLMPWALAMAGGAMLYVVFEELLPEAHRHQDGNITSIGALCGIMLVFVLSG